MQFSCDFPMESISLQTQIFKWNAASSCGFRHVCHNLSNPFVQYWGKKREANDSGKRIEGEKIADIQEKTEVLETIKNHLLYQTEKKKKKKNCQYQIYYSFPFTRAYLQYINLGTRHIKKNPFRAHYIRAVSLNFKI